MIRRWGYISLGFLLFHAALGQEFVGRVRGTVLDEKGNPLIGVNIVVVGTTIGGVSNERGEFEIVRIPPGTYQLIASMVGYKSDTVSTAVTAGGVREANFRLHETVIELSEVRVLGERQRQAQSDTRSSLHFLEPRSAKTLPGFGEDVLRSLQALPGIVAPSDFSAQLVVRGSGPDQNLIVMDDIEVFNPYRLYGLISMFNPETVVDISLMTGGFPAKYGDRLSAVLDVTNKAGNRQASLGANINASISNANLVVEGRTPFGIDGSYLFSARRTYYDLIIGPFAKKSGLVANDVAFPNFSDLQAKVVFGPFKGHRFTVNGLQSRDGVDIVSGDNRNSPDSVDAFNATHHQVVGAAWQYVPHENLSLKTVASFYRNSGTTEFGGSFLDPSLNRERFQGEQRDTISVRVFTVSSQSDYLFQKFSVKQEIGWRTPGHFIEGGAGADFLTTTLNWYIDLDPAIKGIIQARGGTFLERFSETKNYSRAHLYVQDRISLTPRLYFQPGLRLDYYKLLDKFYLAPRINASYALDEITTLRAAYGWYYQSPGYEKLVDSRRNTFASLEPQYARTLDAERATHYVAGVDRWLTDDIQLKVDTYYKQFTDMIITKVVTGTRYVVYPIAGRNPRRRDGWSSPVAVAADSMTNIPTNDGRGKAYGLEIFLEKKRLSSATRLSGWVSYAVAWAEYDERGILIPFNFDQRHTVNVVGNYLAASWLEIGFHWRYGSNFPYTPAKGIRPRLAPITTNGQTSYVVQTDVFGNVIFDVDRGEFYNVNSARKPVYHRLDIRTTAYTTFWGLQWSFYLDVINVYNRSNLLNYNYYVNEDLTLGVRSTHMFPIIPTLGLSIRF